MLRRLVPRPVKVVIRRVKGPLRDSALDVSDMILHRRGELIPPRRMWRMVGGGDYRKVGEELFRYLVDLGGLKMHHRILDIGCGIGRMAAPLTKYLEPPGAYQGLDIVPAAIEWCKKTITPRYPHFRFQLIDVYNRAYNPTGRFRASDYKLPYQDQSFDFAILTSVFTHMLRRDAENYMRELARVLKTEGRCLITFFLINPESHRLIQEGLTTLPFLRTEDGYWTIDRNLPERAIGFDEDGVRGMFQEYDFRIIEPILYGSWVKRDVFLSYQDIIVASKSPH